MNIPSTNSPKNSKTDKITSQFSQNFEGIKMYTYSNSYITVALASLIIILSHVPTNKDDFSFFDLIIVLLIYMTFYFLLQKLKDL